MRPVLTPASPELIAKLASVAERELSAEEYSALCAIPMSEEERDEKRELIRWFCRRYPTPAARLSYARRAYKAWTRSRSR